MGRTVAFLSFRFGATDGVSVVARSWMDVFAEDGWHVVTVTGEPTDATSRPARVVPGLGLEATVASSDLVGPLADSLEDVDLVAVENLLTIPMNLEASRAAATVLAGRPALLHHHDPPWHRERFAHITELPATDPAWRHVAINSILAGELAQRGIDATVVHNGFAPPPHRSAEQRGDLRAHVRAQVGLPARGAVLAHPVRAIERKNVPAAIALAEAVGATYWLLGPAEEGYERELATLLRDARCPVVHHPWPEPEGIYAAADHIVFPSTWEGFGNPPIEAALHRRTVSVGDYPVAAELRSHGFEWFAADDAASVRAVLDEPDAPAVTELLDRNEAVARRDFSIEHMAGRLRSVLDAAGWWT